MCLDGPTFVATEGWNWIPAIRDRDTGIWQPVTLAASGGVRIGDPQVVTSLLPPDTSHASILITVPLENTTNSPVHGRLRAAFDQIEVTKDITAAPGHSEAKLTPAEFSPLMIEHPRLWWPNGYGKQELYQLRLSFSENGTESHVKQLVSESVRSATNSVCSMPEGICGVWNTLPPRVEMRMSQLWLRATRQSARSRCLTRCPRIFRKIGKPGGSPGSPR